MGLFCIWHQIKHFISLWPVRQADERKFLKASVDLCPSYSPLSLSPLCHSFWPVQFFNMPKSCVKISQRDRKQRYKLYELIKQRDPKRGKGQNREWVRERGEGLKIWHMTLIVVPCVRVHAVLCFCPLVPKHFFCFSVIAHIYGTKWGEQRGDRGVTRLGAFRFLLAALKGFQCFSPFMKLLIRGATAAAPSATRNAFCGSCIHS